MKKKRFNRFDFLNIVFITAFCISIVFPFWDIIVRSLSDTSGSSTLEFLLWPRGFTLDSYMYLLRDNSMLRALFVTISRTICGTLLSLALVMLAAFPMSKRNLPFRNFFTVILLIPMFFQGGLIPSYLLNRSLNLVDNFLVYILPGAVGIFHVILARNYLMSLDKSLEESAFLDGAGYMTILTRIIVPLSKPILATLALWIAVYHWNSWFDSLIYARSENLEVIQLKLRRMMTLTRDMQEELAMYMDLNNINNITSNSVRTATTIITILPIVCVYPFIQKYFVKGIMMGSLKG